LTAPRATARLQFHAAFTLDDAARLVPYFSKLGISHLYASPLTRARSGSMHGYDTVDYEIISPDLGGEPALRRLVGRLREFGMGLILDIVPNHMGVGQENAWWWSVLKHGKASPYSEYFDIDWESPDPLLRGKMLAPYLGEPYGAVLEAGQLTLERDAESREFQVAYFDSRFPISPECTPEIEAAQAELAHAYDSSQPQGRKRLHDLLERQHYRLAWWRCGSEEINWRRFFEISDLIGMRVELPTVRDASHGLTFRLYESGLIDGVRVDHIDGLADPQGYCQYLRQSLDALRQARPADVSHDEPYIIVEKILAADEGLSSQWGIDGTTGYDFMSEVGALLHSAAGEGELTTYWQGISGDTRAFYRIVHDVRRRLITQNFAGEFDALVRVLHRIARSELATRDFSMSAIRRVLTDLLVFFPVYRNYATEQGRTYPDEVVFSSASAGARSNLRIADHGLLDVLGAWLGGEAPASVEQPALCEMRLEAIRRFQQLTAPLAAKSVEDTGFYRYGRLLSRNEVGADPVSFSMGIEDFHRKVLARAGGFPDAMLVTATHDHKRGEDARARLAALSEMPTEWLQLVQGWTERHAPFKRQARGVPAPVQADEYMLYQTLLGAWPLDLSADDEEGIAELAGRISEWQTKSLREAKQRSSWVTPADEYEQASNDFLNALVDPHKNRQTLLELTEFIRRIGAVGAVNGLAQTLLRMTVPGVPDLYQGTELWDFSMVDPDNRRPVDYDLRQAMLDDKPAAATLVQTWRDGRIKLEVIRKVLAMRKQEPELFSRGHYLPLPVRGEAQRHVLAFVRQHEGRNAIVVVPICSAELLLAHAGSDITPHIEPSRWGDTEISVVDHLPDGKMTNVLTGEQCEIEGGKVLVRDALAALPVAVLVV
jgi:(1->4)-alpha-D-glucan 1-alpha-D-glucosylmutase